MSKNRVSSQTVGFFLGPIIFLLILLMPSPSGMPLEAQRVIAVTALMAIWWITEAIPIPATSLLPIVLFPALGVMSSKLACAPYSNNLIFLFMGGFFIAVTMEKWNLHKRLALNTIKLVGTSPDRMVLGFMVATGFLSMWVSNTATTMMMVPIGLAVISQVTGLSSIDLREADHNAGKDFNFGRSLMLGTAYAASIGGVGTIIGTPPNAVMVAMIEKLYGQQITFFDWAMVGVPLAIITLFITWLVLTKALFPVKGELSSGDSVIKEQISKLGPMKKEERLVVLIFSTVALLWILRGILLKSFPVLKEHNELKYLHDATIAIGGAVALFCIPTNLSKREFLLDWKTAMNIPWGVLLLFGGGLSLAGGFAQSGLAGWIATQLTLLQGASILMFILAVVIMTVFLTEITSNTATATLLVPIMGAAAIAMDIHPYGPIVAACVSASFAFMLPVATPPNAVVFGSGCVTIPQMCKSGIWLNIISIILITLAVTYFLPMVWGIDLTTLPDWAAVEP
jgi:solute carrier family 13 (sodium-dependent dicarboxylate transporter), member 2/3/5